MLITTVQMLEARSTGQRETRPSIRPAGFEPATDGLENRCSILLSYGRNLLDPARKRQATRLAYSPQSSCARQDSNLRPAV